MAVLDQLFLELGKIDPTIGVLVDLDYVSERFAPGELIRMVLVWAYEYRRA